MKTTSVAPQKLHNAIHRVVPGRVMAYFKRRYSALFETILRNADSKRSNSHARAASVGTSYVWHDIHCKIAESRVLPCAYYGVFMPRAKVCSKPAICPNCGARQFEKAFKLIADSGAARGVITRVVSNTMSKYAVAELMSTMRSVIRQSNADTFALLPRLFPCEQVKTVKFVTILIACNSANNLDFDAFVQPTAYPTTVDTFEITDAGIDFAVNKYAKYPVKLLTLDPVSIKYAYSAIGGVRASFTRNKKKHDLKDKRQYNTGRFAPGVANLEIQTTDSGGCLSEPGVCSGLVPEQQLLTEAGR